MQLFAYLGSEQILTLTLKYLGTSTTAGLDATPTLQELSRYVTDIAPYYYDIGLELDIRNSQVIKSDSSLPNLTDKCQKMFEVWLETDTCATWKKLCDALEENNIKYLLKR